MLVKMLLTSTLLAACAIAQPGLTGINWNLTQLNGTPVKAGVYTIQFKTGGEAGGTVNCNTCGWTYSTNGAAISIESGLCTMMACENSTRDYEYQTALASTTSYKLSGAFLYLINKSDTLAVFADQAYKPTITFEGTWKLDKLNNSALNLAGYSLTFTSDSTSNVHMLCNSCSYHYVATSQKISFSRGRCTLMACQGKSREGEFSAAMDKTTRWLLKGPKLFLMSASDTLMEYSVVTSGLPGKVWQLQSIWQKSGRIFITSSGNIVVNTRNGYFTQVRIIDVRGRCVLQVTQPAQSDILIDASELPTGLFIIRASTAAGSSLFERIHLTR